MNLNNIFNVVQIIIAVLLTVAILIQQRGTGLGGAFGGEGGVYYKKRGLEKVIFTGTIVLSVLFIITAILRMLI